MYESFYITHLEPLYRIKLKDFDINHFDNWKKSLNNTHLSTKYKNDILKFLKSIMNYATVWHEINFTKVYPKMTKFVNPSEVDKEMMYFTYEQFKQFIAVEDILRFKVMFEILYYCGLRKGELRGLQWKDIDLERKTLSVRKQITDRCGTVKKFKFVVPKTPNSIRTLKMPEILVNSLKKAQKRGISVAWIQQ